MMTLDFEDYVSSIQKAQDQFFQDRIARSQSMQSLIIKQEKGFSREDGPDLRMLAATSSRRQLE
jgi:ribosomal protein L14